MNDKGEPGKRRPITGQILGMGPHGNSLITSAGGIIIPDDSRRHSSAITTITIMESSPVSSIGFINIKFV